MEIKSMRLASSATLLLYYYDSYDHYSSPVTLHPHLWMLYEGGGVVSPGDTVERVTVWNSYRDSIEITQLRLHSEGNATVNATVVIGNDRYDVGLGSEKTVINLEAPLVISGPQTIEISYMSGGVKYGTIKPVLDADFEHTIIDRADGAYILAAPTKPAIDGIFADWSNAHKSPRSKLPADIDLTNYDSKAYGEETYVYVSVYGMLFGPGTPEIKVSGNATGGNETINKTLPSNTLEIYVDADQNEKTGYRIGGIGADYLVRLSGCVGIVKKVDTLVWSGSGWKPGEISMKYAKNDESMEVGIHLTGNVYYRMVNWKGKWDETKTYMVRYDGGTLLLSGSDKSSAVYSKPASVTLVGRYTKQELKLVFGNDKQVTTSSDPEIRPSITRTADGTLWITFHDSSSGRLQFANSTDGGNTWTVYNFSRTTTPTNPLIFSTSHTTDHVIINEVYYDPSGPDPQVEWIELYNPTDKNVDISGYVIADDPNKQATSYEGTWTIPSGTVIPAKGYILIVNDATYKNGFSNEFPGITPDFDTNTSNTIPDVATTGRIVLSNDGDDIHLFNSAGVEIDTVWYGDGDDMGSTNASVDVPEGHSIARYYDGWDTNNSANDFYDEANPSPRGMNAPSKGDLYIFFENHTANSYFQYYFYDGEGWTVFHISSWTWWGRIYNLSVSGYTEMGNEILYLFMEYENTRVDHDISFVKYAAGYWWHSSNGGPLIFSIHGTNWEGHIHTTISHAEIPRLFVTYDWFDSTNNLWKVDVLNNTEVNNSGWTYFTISHSTYGVYHPDIASSVEYIYLVAVFGYNGGDLILFNSTDNGKTWSDISLTVSSTSDSLDYPRISADGLTVYVVYMNVTTRYVMEIESQNGGYSWSDPVKVSDTATCVDLYETIGIYYDGGKLHVVWTDSRDGNSNIFYDNGIPEFNDYFALVFGVLIVSLILRRKRFK